MLRLILQVTLTFVYWSHRISGTPLDDYVNKVDRSYKYDVIGAVKQVGCTIYTINMTSQTWMPGWQSRPVWWHNVTITIPDKIIHNNTALLMVAGGRNDRKPSITDDLILAMVAALANTTGSITATVSDIPNQPITFYDRSSTHGDTEDGLVAWSWKRFLDGHGANPELLVNLPMTKAVVRAMDTVTDFVRRTTGAGVETFTVTGGSKRGLVSWLTGAVDKRAVAIAPIVYDSLNMSVNMQHWYRSLGGWTFALQDYVKDNITGRINTQAFQKLASIIDPMVYNDRYANLPILVTSSGGDEFFTPDDSRFYFDQLKGQKYLRQLPNAEHTTLGHTTTLVLGLRAFYLSVITKTPLPKFNWTKEVTTGGGRIRLTSNVKPSSIVSYHATTLDGKRKDFRLMIGTPGNPTQPQFHPVLWLPKPVTRLGHNVYEVAYTNPAMGWTAFFMQVTFPGVAESVLEFTTETLIIPDTYPFPACRGRSCDGPLV